MQRSHRRASLVIVVFLGLQAATFPLRTSLFWPFLTYPMYSNAYSEAFANEFFIYAELGDGRDVAFTPAYAGLGFFAWENRYRRPLSRGTGNAGDEIAQLVLQREGAPVQRLRLEVVRHEIDDDAKAIVSRPPRVRHYDLSAQTPQI